MSLLCLRIGAPPMEHETGLPTLPPDLRPYAGKDVWVAAPRLSMRELEIAFWQADTLIVEGLDGCRIVRFNGEDWHAPHP